MTDLMLAYRLAWGIVALAAMGWCIGAGRALVAWWQVWRE